MIWYLYVIRTVDNCLYTGIATDVQRRFREHTAGGAAAAKYFCAHTPHSLAFSRKIGSRSQALKVEYRFKRLTKKAKETIIKRDTLLFDRKTGKISIV
ncbi:MAG: GIY-YIG nuclease family protein [Chitinispirillaceae bacterium]|nr:GIY-YIG nuclease family protein [Chitinispirillaceae bacterium]